MSSSTELLAAYGEAVFYGHLIEDMLKVHLFDCSFFKRNCMAHVPLEKIRRMQFEDLIDMLRLSEPEDDSMEGFVERLHVLRRARNILVHGFVLQIHKELQSKAGREQITAMLQRFSFHARVAHQKLSADAFAFQKEALRQDYTRIFDHPGYPGKETEGTVAASEIQKLLKALDAS